MQYPSGCQDTLPEDRDPGIRSRTENRQIHRSMKTGNSKLKLLKIVSDTLLTLILWSIINQSVFRE